MALDPTNYKSEVQAALSSPVRRVEVATVPVLNVGGVANNVQGLGTWFKQDSRCMGGNQMIN